MTAAAEDTWIESSLARLETLEAQRNQLAASGQTGRLAELDEEIRGLYEALESVAGDDEPAPASANQPMATPIAVALPAMSAAPAAAPMVSPAPEAAAPSAVGFGAVPAPGPSPGPDMQPMPASYTADIDIRPPRSSLPLILGAVLVLGGGAAAFMFMSGDKTDEAKAEPTGPAQVIKAGAVVEDTQEPQVAHGADGDRTRGTVYKEGSQDKRASQGSRPRNSGSRSSGSRTAKKDDGRKIAFEKGTKDPLGGVE